MTENEQKLEQLSVVAAQLNQQTEAITSEIKQLGKSLEKMKLGVSVWLEEQIKDDAGNTYRLGFARVKDKWRIVAQNVAVKRNKLEEVEEAISLTKAPRIVRVRALPHLDALVDALTAKASLILQSMQNTGDDANEESPPKESASESVATSVY